MLALGADGSVFLGSSQTADLSVVKLEPNGAPAGEFGSNGRATTTGGGRVAGLFPGAGGGVAVVVGHSNGDDIGLVRYTSTGVVDTASGAQSILVGLPPPAGALAVATTATGTVAVAGFTQDEAGRTGMHVALLSRGLPSKTFGANGEVTVFAGREARATSVGVDPHGRIVAGGSSSDGSASRWLVARFRPDGTLDPGFGVSGLVGSPETSATDSVAGLAVLPDSRVLLLVHQGGRELVIRLAADGSPDRGVVAAGDGLACAWIDARGVVIRRSDPAISSAVAAGVAVQRDGAILVAGTTPAGIAVARRLPDGRLDTGFGNGGLATRTGLDASGIAVQRDGRIDVAVCSRTASQLGVLRFFATGGVDASFGDNGLAETDDGGITHAIAVLSGGVIVAGTAPVPRGTDFAVVMLYQDSRVAPVVGTLFHVTPKGVARRIARDATQPAWSRAAGLLAYVRDDDGAAGISVRRGNAGRRIVDSPLPSGAVVVGDPQWSRDGTLLALRVLDAEGTRSVAVLSPAGGPVRRVVAATGAAWTAGRDLAYATATDEIRIVDADTGEVRRVTIGSEVRPAPLGSLLAVEKGAWTLVRPDGTVVSRLPPRFYDPR